MSSNLSQQSPLVGRPARTLDLSRARELLARLSMVQTARTLGVHRNTLYYHLSHAERIKARRTAIAAKRKRDAAAGANTERRQASWAYRDAHGELLLLICLIYAVKIERVCNRCLISKPLSAFYYKREVQDYRTTCIECCRVRSLEIWHDRGRFNRVRVSRRVAPLSEFYPYLLNREVDGADIISTVNNLVPRAMAEQERADFCQELVLAVLSGEIAPEHLSFVLPQRLKEFRRQLPSKYRDIFLDAPLYGENRYSLLDTLSTEDTLGAWMARNPYGGALDDCEDAEDLAERLRGAWEANRLTEPRRKTYDIHAADHKTDNRVSAPAPVSSGRGGMHVGVRRYRYMPPTRAGIERKLGALAWAVEDYRQARITEELGGE